MRELTTCEVENVNGAGKLGDQFGNWVNDTVKGIGQSIGGGIGGFLFPIFGIGKWVGGAIGGLITAPIGGIASTIIKTVIIF